jgi:Arc/MetJ-type ribon-helix-helix transcriptional regulator
VKSLTVRLPEKLVAEIREESQARRLSKSDVVRERLQQPRAGAGEHRSMRGLIGDLIGSVKGLPADVSSKKKQYLRDSIRGKKNYRR